MSFYLFSEFTNMFSPYQFNPFNYHPLQDILKEMINIEKLKTQSAIKLFICATNVRSGKIHIFDNKELSIEAILASACLPQLFQAVEVDNEFYWDGGYLGNPAIFPLIYNTSSQDILILHTVPLVRPELPTTIIDINTRLREISFNSSLSREMRAIAFVSRMLENDWLKPEYKNKLKKCYVHCVRADEIMREYSHASVMTPDWDFLLHLKALGRQKLDEWLEENFKHLGKKTTLNLDEWL
jgi:NTE family protein